MVKLGDKVKDEITGYEGIVMAKATYLYGCEQILIQGRVKKDGEIPDAMWMDEPQAIVTEENTKPQAEPKHGGVRSHP